MSAPYTLNLVWNRACFGSGSELRSGDVALAALLLFHGPAMNGGVLHAAECLSVEELAAARNGYIYFGFSQVANLIDEAKHAQGLDIELDELERDLNKRYWDRIPSDATLSKAFEADHAAHPENYAPIQ